MPDRKRTQEEMISLAYNLQNAILALCGRRPLRITTNKDFNVLRVMWMKDYERKEWYNGVGMKILLQAFHDKHGIYVREITSESDSHTSVYLTKTSTDPEKKADK